jgi:RNA polymerase sigma-70 factor (ECF subfamily)
LENFARVLRPPEEVAVPGPGPDAPPIADEELLESSRGGDLAAFERLFERHGARMKSIAANLLGSAQDAEDAVQESFLKVYRGAASFRGGARFSTWIYRILVNTCYDQVRRRRRRPEGTLTDVTDARFEPPSPGSDHPLRLALEQSLARVPERPRTVFLLSAVEGFTHREIGEILGVPEATSRTLLFEARRELQRLLQDGRTDEARA